MRVRRSLTAKIVLGIPRTQNAVEAWHNRLNILVDAPHPNAYNLFEEIQKEEHVCSGEIRLLLLGGGTVTRKRRTYLAREAAIKQLLEAKDTYANVTEYLAALAFRLQEASASYTD